MNLFSEIKGKGIFRVISLILLAQFLSKPPLISSRSIVKQTRTSGYTVMDLKYVTKRCHSQRNTYEMRTRLKISVIRKD